MVIISSSVLHLTVFRDMVDHTIMAFDLADKYRIPAMIITDGMVGQMIEAVSFPDYKKPSTLPPKDWAIGGERKRNRNIVRTLWLSPADAVEKNNIMLQEKYREIEKNETRFEEYKTEGAEIIFAAFGIAARICKGAVDALRAEGIKCGLIRPITIWPFPSEIYEEYALKKEVKFFMDVELNAGQMLEDVKLAVKDKKPVHFYGRLGGYVPSIDEIINVLKKYL